MSNAPSPRFKTHLPWRDGYQAVAALQATLDATALDKIVQELVKTRVSQLNGCAYCIDMHTKDALALGETPQRLFALSAWRETPFFSDAERAALALAEEVTLIAESHPTDATVDEARRHFDEEQFLQLLYVIATINVWNRLAVTAGSPAGRYVSRYERHD
ncbi:MAG TPA: carboxymuconolactone decarboxylase family protein [Tepidiformaceae bacterium]|nr:carboxymuconolactone decarboxylase family protein [Tepidiformaceae bacterium]